MPPAGRAVHKHPTSAAAAQLGRYLAEHYRDSYRQRLPLLEHDLADVRLARTRINRAAPDSLTARTHGE
jgi:hypothetical protein